MVFACNVNFLNVQRNCVQKNKAASMAVLFAGEVGREHFLATALDAVEGGFLVKPHTNKFACFLLPYYYGCPLGTSDCLSTDTVYAQRSSSRRSVKFRT